jgi:hypothetical protein
MLRLAIVVSEHVYLIVRSQSVFSRSMFSAEIIAAPAPRCCRCVRISLSQTGPVCRICISHTAAITLGYGSLPALQSAEIPAVVVFFAVGQHGTAELLNGHNGPLLRVV